MTPAFAELARAVPRHPGEGIVEWAKRVRDDGPEAVVAHARAAEAEADARALHDARDPDPLRSCPGCGLILRHGACPSHGADLRRKREGLGLGPRDLGLSRLLVAMVEAGDVADVGNRVWFALVDALVPAVERLGFPSVLPGWESPGDRMLLVQAANIARVRAVAAGEAA